MKKPRNIIYLFIIFLFFNLNTAFSSEFKIEKIEIKGNKRIPISFISNITNKYLNKKISNDDINNITKALYKSDFFDDILISVKNRVLIVNVKEIPIVNDIFFQGNDFFSDDELREIIKIKKRDTFSKKNLNEAVENLKLQYSKSGRKFVKISVNQKPLTQSRVDIMFEITEGELIKVNKIEFVGNRFFSENKLKSLINTKEAKFYRFLGGSVFKEENIILDQELLKKFYMRRGFVDFKVLSYKRELLQDYSGFNIRIMIDEGSPFKISNIIFENKLSKIKNSVLLSKVDIESGNDFDQRAIEESLKNLNNFFEADGFTFIKINYEILNKDEKKGLLDLKFKINEGNKSFVRRININGNTRTLDQVLRRELLLLEGDPFNGQRLRDSLKALKRLGYFKKVDVEILQTDKSGEIDIDINVVENRTGSFSFGIGYDSIEKESVQIGLKENNFLGEGLKTRFTVNSSGQSTKYNVGITEPYFLDTPLLVAADIFDQKTERDDKNFDKRGMILGIGYKSNGYFNNFGYSYVNNKTTVDSDSTATSTSGEEGKDIVTSAISYKISSNTTDDFLFPSEGSKSSIEFSLAGIGGDAKYVKGETSYKQYIPINYGDYVFSYGAKAGAISALDNEKVTSSNRFYFNSRSVRGFDSNGIGPRDKGNDTGIGGNKYYSGTLEFKAKKLAPGDLDIDFSIFTDIGSLWETDYPNNVRGKEDSSLRASTGVAVYWNTIVGPLSFIWGFPILDETYDKENNFKFSIGTNF